MDDLYQEPLWARSGHNPSAVELDLINAAVKGSPEESGAAQVGGMLPRDKVDALSVVELRGRYCTLIGLL